MRNVRTPKNGDIMLYKRAIESGIGKDVEVDCIVSGRTSRTLKGTIDYTSNAMFGVKVTTKESTYMMSFSYIDVFTHKIDLRFVNLSAEVAVD